MTRRQRAIRRRNWMDIGLTVFEALFYVLLSCAVITGVLGALSGALR